MYRPPFYTAPGILNLAAEISAKIERYAIALELYTPLRLRKANRIKTIISSLAIEGNPPGANAHKIGNALGTSGRMASNHIYTSRKLDVDERIGSNKSGCRKVNIL